MSSAAPAAAAVAPTSVAVAAAAPVLAPSSPFLASGPLVVAYGAPPPPGSPIQSRPHGETSGDLAPVAADAAAPPLYGAARRRPMALPCPRPTATTRMVRLRWLLVLRRCRHPRGRRLVRRLYINHRWRHRATPMDLRRCLPSTPTQPTQGRTGLRPPTQGRRLPRYSRRTGLRPRHSRILPGPRSSRPTGPTLLVLLGFPHYIRCLLLIPTRSPRRHRSTFHICYR